MDSIIEIHLASGAVIKAVVEIAPEVDEDEFLEGLTKHALLGRPHWAVIGDALVFTGAVSAIQFPE